jgi:hypothetical protein
MTPPSAYECTKCGWSGSELRWSPVADSFGRHAGECPACNRALKGCHLTAKEMRLRARVARTAHVAVERGAPGRLDVGTNRKRKGAIHGIG